jgi:hypothetical protein
MPIAFVFDENLRGKPLWHAIRHHDLAVTTQIDVTRDGDSVDLPLGALDADNLAWAEVCGRIVVTEDAATFPGELAAHLRSGQTSPGVFVIRPIATVGAVVAWLELVAADDPPDKWRDQLIYIP